MTKTFYSVLFITLCFAKTFAQNNTLAIIPQPLQIDQQQGVFDMGKTSKLVIVNKFSDASPEALVIQNLCKEKINIPTVISSSSLGNIIITKDEHITNPEEYYLTISSKQIAVKAATRQGVFYAIQTLGQLFSFCEKGAGKIKLPCVFIHDKPRFSYRALMLDPARNFLPVEALKKYIDVMALYKYNTLHLHLADDQGWRVEIKSMPRLAEIGSVRAETNGDGVPEKGFYTQEQLKDLVRYAADRYIEIIPEIDVPGHSVALLAAYPALSCRQQQLTVVTKPGVSKELLCAGNPEVYQVYETIFKEMADIFPSKRFHIGGDEAPLDNWKICPKCQKTMAENKLKSEQELMSYFFKRMDTLLKKNGKAPQFWYELDVPDYPAGSTMHVWRFGTAKQVVEKTREKGYKMICSDGDYAYFDFPQSPNDISFYGPVLTLEQVYRCDPGYGLSAELSKHIIGVEACVWGEYIKTPERAFYMTWPRALAMSEAGWSDMRNRNWKSFAEKVPIHLDLLLKKGVNYRAPAELYAN